MSDPVTETPLRQKTLEQSDDNIEESDNNIEESDKDTESLDGSESKVSSVDILEAITDSLDCSESEVSYQCEFCEDQFSYRQDLTKHIARIHEENGESYAPRKKAKASLDCSKSEVSSVRKNKLDKEVDLDDLLKGNFAIIYDGDIKKYLNEKSIKIFKKLNTSLINIHEYSFKNSEFREMVKSGNIIVRPDLFIYGVTDSDNNLDEISNQLFDTLLLN